MQRTQRCPATALTPHLGDLLRGKDGLVEIRLSLQHRLLRCGKSSLSLAFGGRDPSLERADLLVKVPPSICQCQRGDHRWGIAGNIHEIVEGAGHSTMTTPTRRCLQAGQLDPPAFKSGQALAQRRISTVGVGLGRRPFCYSQALAGHRDL